MNVAILGTRGIPNMYGGFEKCAVELSVRFVQKGHSVTVYTPVEHSFKGIEYKGIKLRRIFCREDVFKGFGTTLYDALCLRDAEKQGFDVLLELGYNPASLFFPKKRKIPIVTNMDGLEWKRSKWNPLIQKLSRKFEGRAVKRSDLLISDNVGIQEYLYKTYGASSVFIPYGAEVDEATGGEFGFEEISDYYLIVARLEPENQLELMIQGYLLEKQECPLVIVGGLNTKYAKYLVSKYSSSKVKFVGGVYDQKRLRDIRKGCKVYLHGHSVGGTNPSLLEAMGLGLNILSHDNSFNRAVLQRGAYYFDSPEKLAELLQNVLNLEFSDKVVFNQRQIQEIYNWDFVADQYLEALEQVRRKSKPYDNKAEVL